MLQHKKDENKKREKENDEFTEYQRLKSRYQDRPFHERNFAWYWLAVCGAVLSNIISGVTESAKLFALFFGMFGSITYGFEVSIVCMMLGIIIIEFTHRTFARTYFKEYVLVGGHTREQNSNLFGMIFCLLLSVSLSISGQFDGLRILINPPMIAEVEQMDIDKVHKAISPIVNDAKDRANNYYNRRKYKGRIAQEDKRKYKEYEDHATRMEDSLMSAIMRIPKINNEVEETVRKRYFQDLKLYEAQIQSKGIGLLVVTLPAILILYLSLWFEERYIKKKTDYLIAKFEGNAEKEIDSDHSPTLLLEENAKNKPSQLPLKQSEDRSKSSSNGIHPPEVENSIKGFKTLQMNIPIGYYSPAQKRANELLQYVATRKEKDFPHEKVDKYTILHFNFKTGKPIRYPKERVNWYVKHYAEKLEEAMEKSLGEDVLLNRKSKLLYWQSRQKELQDKLEVG